MRWSPCPWCGEPCEPGHNDGKCETVNGSFLAGEPLAVHRNWWLEQAARGGPYKLVGDADADGFVLVVWVPPADGPVE